MISKNINIKTNKSSSINQQARLLMADNRKRQYNCQARMLERATAEVGLQ